MGSSQGLSLGSLWTYCGWHEEEIWVGCCQISEVLARRIWVSRKWFVLWVKNRNSGGKAWTRKVAGNCKEKNKTKNSSGRHAESFRNVEGRGWEKKKEERKKEEVQRQDKLCSNCATTCTTILRASILSLQLQLHWTHSCSTSASAAGSPCKYHGCPQLQHVQWAKPNSAATTTSRGSLSSPQHSWRRRKSWLPGIHRHQTATILPILKPSLQHRRSSRLTTSGQSKTWKAAWSTSLPSLPQERSLPKNSCRSVKSSCPPSPGSNTCWAFTSLQSSIWR